MAALCPAGLSAVDSSPSRQCKEPGLRASVSAGWRAAGRRVALLVLVFCLHHHPVGLSLPPPHALFFLPLHFTSNFTSFRIPIYPVHILAFSYPYVSIVVFIFLS